MRVAVDTSVLLDVLGADPAHGGASRAALKHAYDAGSLVASDVVWAETRAQYSTDQAFAGAMEALGVAYLETSATAAVLAGAIWRLYHQRRRRDRSSGHATRRVTADFLVGAHARVQADALLTRDRGFYRGYFKDLRIIEP
jgi:hypothetical protein